ncbi:cysteine protease ATG4C isoform X2 [Sapajus apella]|uniref:Cysteine protease n=1 Tax=Sapajus apella TaxID=9515 RepID=A0A6J3JDU2_SAPAP|nr:cysteine protease ATG4C isoform X2 [Sapajus apella]
MLKVPVAAALRLERLRVCGLLLWWLLLELEHFPGWWLLHIFTVLQFFCFGWVLKTKTYFSRNSPVLLLGKCYHFKYEDEDKMLPTTSGCTIEDHVIAGNVEEFRKDFISRIWLTYREEFPQIEGSALTTDCGWGCTLRTGQMLLAQGLILHFLGRAWTWPDALNIENSDSESWTSHTVKKFTASFEASLSGERELKTPTISLKETIGKYSDDHEMRNEIYHRKIISWFGDSPLAVFGLHQLIEYGKKSGKKAGDWYGPAVVAHILRKAVEEARHPDLQGITIYVAQDCTVYNSDVIDKQSASMTSDNADDKAVIILVPVRLGGERTNTDYLEFVKGILSLEYCVGIIGGKPKQSYYFAGFQDDSLIYMDPHYCQSFVDVSIKDFPLETFHCPSPKKMSFRKMDPSCTIGFYCRNVQDFERASEEITKMLKFSSKEKYPLFTFVNGHSRDYDFTSTTTNEEDLFSEDEKKQLKRFSTEEFVLL